MGKSKNKGAWQNSQLMSRYYRLNKWLLSVSLTVSQDGLTRHGPGESWRLMNRKSWRIVCKTCLILGQQVYYGSWWLNVRWRNCLLAGLLLTLEAIIWWPACDVAGKSTCWRDGWHGLPCSLMCGSSTHVSHICCWHDVTISETERAFVDSVAKGELWCTTGTLTLLGWSLNGWKQAMSSIHAMTRDFLQCIVACCPHSSGVGDYEEIMRKSVIVHLWS